MAEQLKITLIDALKDDWRIGPDEVPKVLMALIAERFKDLWAFETWLMQNDIQVTRTAF